MESRYRPVEIDRRGSSKSSLSPSKRVLFCLLARLYSDGHLMMRWRTWRNSSCDRCRNSPCTTSEFLREQRKRHAHHDRERQACSRIFQPSAASKVTADFERRGPHPRQDLAGWCCTARGGAPARPWTDGAGPGIRQWRPACLAGFASAAIGDLMRSSDSPSSNYAVGRAPERPRSSFPGSSRYLAQRGGAHDGLYVDI